MQITPTKYNLSIQAGETVTRQMQLLTADGSPFDLTSYTVKSQVRVSYSTGSAVAAEFVPAIVSPATSGTFQLSLSAVSSSLLTQSVYYYDVRISTGSERYFIAEGKVCVSPAITRD